eukprot:gene974-1151_t
MNVTPPTSNKRPAETGETGPESTIKKEQIQNENELTPEQLRSIKESIHRVFTQHNDSKILVFETVIVGGFAPENKKNRKQQFSCLLPEDPDDYKKIKALKIKVLKRMNRGVIPIEVRIPVTSHESLEEFTQVEGLLKLSGEKYEQEFAKIFRGFPPHTKKAKGAFMKITKHPEIVN